jgi:hypothetical protein
MTDGRRVPSLFKYDDCQQEKLVSGHVHALIDNTRAQIAADWWSAEYVQNVCAAIDAVGNGYDQWRVVLREVRERAPIAVRMTADDQDNDEH